MSLEPRREASIAGSLVSPVGLGLLAAGAVVGWLAGSLLVGVVLGVLLWGFRVAWAAMRSGARPARGALSPPRLGAQIDPFAVGEPWRNFVRGALQARNRFNEAVSRAGAGPVRERLVDISHRLDQGVEQCWITAQKGQQLREARKRIDTNVVAQRIAETRRAGGPELSDTAAKTVRALESQIESAARLDGVIADAESRLKLLQAQLDEAVARGVELTVKAGDPTALAGVGDDIDHVVEEMEALRLALEETNGGAAA
ncbi:MAG: hypothetical protein ACKVWR_20450 [Acidimicrobiales bacterium]